MQLETHNAPNKSTAFRITEAQDADLHASHLTGWQQEYDQTSRGSFYGSIVERQFDDLQVFREHTSQALQQKCVVWPDSIWLGIPLADQVESRINGLPVQSNAVMCRQGNAEFELTTPQNYDLYGLVINKAKLSEMANVHGVDLNWKELTTHGRLGLPDKTLHDFRFLLARLLTVNKTETPARLQREILMMALLEVVSLETPLSVTPQSYPHRKSVVDCARRFLNEHSESPVTVTQLCKAANVSRRTLQYSFESILGVSPIQYLRISRLNGARRSLVQASLTNAFDAVDSLPQVSNQTVSDIASQWGFWHLSQFAKDYKQLFDENPSQTLKR